MKSYFDQISFETSKLVTHTYSTSFGTAVRLLAPSIRQDIYNIYGFVRLADEIVDSFQSYNQHELFTKFREDLQRSLNDGISTNPILNAFQHTMKKYSMSPSLVNAFMDSMQRDLTQKDYKTVDEYKQYIYGSADVVGLMCLYVFVAGDNQKYEYLKGSAMRLGSAFQKINFLRDIKDDFHILNRSYFPNTDLGKFGEMEKTNIVTEIEEDLRIGFLGILELPIEAKLGVYTAYCYYRKLLSKLKRLPSGMILQQRIRVPDYEKFGLFAKCYVHYKLNII